MPEFYEDPHYQSSQAFLAPYFTSILEGDIPDYYDHLKAQVRVLEDGPGGKKVARYVASGPDHLGQAENYCTVASTKRRWREIGFLRI